MAGGLGSLMCLLCQRDNSVSFLCGFPISPDFGGIRRLRRCEGIQQRPVAFTCFLIPEWKLQAAELRSLSQLDLGASTVPSACHFDLRSDTRNEKSHAAGRSPTAWQNAQYATELMLSAISLEREDGINTEDGVVADVVAGNSQTGNNVWQLSRTSGPVVPDFGTNQQVVQR